MAALLYPLAHRHQESARLLDFHPESQVLVHMSPASYLGYCATRHTPFEWTQCLQQLQQWSESKGLLHQHGESNSMLRIKTRLESALPLDALFLDTNPTTGSIVSQEGLHRAFLAKEMDIALVPVLIFAYIRNQGFINEEDMPGVLNRLRARFDEAPALSREVSAALAAENAPEIDSMP